MEGIYLIHHAPGVAPRFTQLAPPTNVRDGVNDSTIEQSTTRRRETRRNRNPVRAIAVKQHRRRAIKLDATAIHDRHWNLRPVGSGREYTFGFVIRFIKAAGNF